MTAARISHQGPGQTDPGIYASEMHFVRNDCSLAARFRQWSINLTLGGSCVWQSGDYEVCVGRGDLLITRPNSPLSWQVAPGEREWHVLYAVTSPSPRCESWLNAHRFHNSIAVLRAGEFPFTPFHRRLREVFRVYRSRLRLRDEWSLLALERALLALHSGLEHGAAALDPRVEDALEFIHANMARKLTCADIARAVHLSPSHLSSLFARHLDEAPMQYLERSRCERAAEMLRFTANPIRSIAAATGFPDCAYFCNRFRRYSGQAPGEFRRAARSV